MQPIEPTELKPISYELVIIMECLKAVRLGESITIEKISQTLADIRNKNNPEVFVLKCALKQIPGGLYSDDVAIFLYYQTQGLGYAIHESDGSFKLLDKALALFVRFLGEFFAENPKMFTNLSIELNFSLQDVMYALDHRSSQE